MFLNPNLYQVHISIALPEMALTFTTITRGRRARANEDYMPGGKGNSGGQEWDWMKDLEEDLKAFWIKFEGWCEAAQKVGRWFQRVEGGGGYHAEIAQG